MRIATAHLESVSRYSQSKNIQSSKEDRELPIDFEQRTWRERCHVDQDGNVFIPPMSFANSIKQAAKYLSIQVPGKGKSTFTKNFEAGVMVVDPLVLPVKVDNVKSEMLFVPSDGMPGGGKRVNKIFPYVDSWSGSVDFYILDDLITKDVFLRVLETSGALIGIGRFRPKNRGYYGRFKVVGIDWADNV